MDYSSLRELLVACNAMHVVELTDRMVDIFDNINYTTYMASLEVAFYTGLENGDNSAIESVYCAAKKLMISLVQNFGITVTEDITNDDLVNLLQFLTTIEKHEDHDTILSILDSLHCPQEVLMELLTVVGGHQVACNLSCDIIEVDNALLAKLRELIMDKRASYLEMTEDKTKIIKVYRGIKIIIPVIGEVWCDRFASNPDVMGLPVAKYLAIYKHEVFDHIEITGLETSGEKIAADIVLMYAISQEGMLNIMAGVSNLIGRLTTDYKLSTIIFKRIETLNKRYLDDQVRTIS